MEYMLRPTEAYVQQPSIVHSKCNYDDYQLWVVTIKMREYASGRNELPPEGVWALA